MKNAYDRAVESIRGHAAATHFLKRSRKSTPPKSVEFIKFHEKDTDLWGATQTSIYRVTNDICERFPGRPDVLIAFEVIRRTKATYYPNL